VLGRRTAPGPTASTVEPMMHPISAWLLDVGGPTATDQVPHDRADDTPHDDGHRM